MSPREEWPGRAPGTMAVLAIGRAAAGLGHLNFNLDVDGGVRTVPLVVQYYERYFPALPLLIAANTGFGNGGKAQLEKYAAQYGITIAISGARATSFPRPRTTLTRTLSSGVVLTSTEDREPGCRNPPTAQPLRRAIRPPSSMSRASDWVMSERAGSEWTFHQTQPCQKRSGRPMSSSRHSMAPL